MRKLTLNDLPALFPDTLVDQFADREIEIREAVAEFIQPNVDVEAMNQAELSMHTTALCLAIAEFCITSRWARTCYRWIVRIVVGSRLNLHRMGKGGDS